MPSPTSTTRVLAVRDVAPEVREITLAPTEPPLTWAPGQWLSLHLPVGAHPPLVRAYSLAAPPSASGEMVLCLDRVPQGLGSEYLFALKAGDPVTLAGPLGHFVLPDPGADLLWLARYTGIVPFRAMLLHLAQNPPAYQVTLVYSAPQAEDLAYGLELQALAEKHSWFRLLSLTDGSKPDSGLHEAAQEAAAEWMGDRRDFTPMICGKKEFVRPLRDFFYGLGWDRRAVKWENYD